MNEIKGRNIAASIALYALLLLFFLLITVFGAIMYRDTTVSAANNNSTRASLSYVVSRIQTSDEAGAVSVQNGPQGDMLVIAEPLEATDYETLIYIYDGTLMEQYVRADTQPQPDNAQKIADTDKFNVSVNDGIVCIETSDGYTEVYLKSEGAAK